MFFFFFSRLIRFFLRLSISLLQPRQRFQSGGLFFADLPFLLGIHLEFYSELCTLIMVVGLDFNRTNENICFTQFLPEMGVAIGCLCILLIGVDRMFSAYFTLSYQRFNHRYYYLVRQRNRSLDKLMFEVFFCLGFSYCGFLCYVMLTFYQPG